MHIYLSPLLEWEQAKDRIYLFTSKFPSGASDKESTCQCRICKSLRFYHWVGKITWSRKWWPSPVFLPGKFHGQRSLVGYSPWDQKELDTTEHTHIHTHTHILFMSGIVYWTLSVNDYIVQEKYDRIYGCQKKQNLYRIKLFSRNTWASVDRRWRQTPYLHSKHRLVMKKKKQKSKTKECTLRECCPTSRGI